MYCQTNVLFWMKINKLWLHLLFAVVMLTGFAAHGQEYHEDLSPYRPKYDTADYKVKEARPDTIRIRNAINEKADSITDVLADVYEKYKHSNGYRIQIYSGGKQSEAKDARNKAHEIVGKVPIYIEWESPVFRVKVGDYLDKLRAYRIYKQLQEEFENALLVPDKIKLEGIE